LVAVAGAVAAWGVVVAVALAALVAGIVNSATTVGVGVGSGRRAQAASARTARARRAREMERRGGFMLSL